MLKKVLKKSIVCCLLVCLLVCMTVVTAAAETEMGTVNIKFPSSAKGITIVAYEIGYYAEGEYIVNENFSGSDVSLEGIELADASEVQQISQTLMDYAENQGYEGKEVFPQVPHPPSARHQGQTLWKAKTQVPASR